MGETLLLLCFVIFAISSTVGDAFEPKAPYETTDAGQEQENDITSGAITGTIHLYD